MTHLDLEWRD